MKTIVLGDIHGRGIWQLIVQIENPDRLVFIGDYFDAFEIPYIDQMYNFKQIVHYARTSGKEVILLTGNHVLYYFFNILSLLYYVYNKQKVFQTN